MEEKKKIGKKILEWIADMGTIEFVGLSPFFVINLTRKYGDWTEYKNRQISNAFYRLRKQGLISIKKINRQIYISLTEEGKKRAGKYQIDDLKIKKPKRWDKKWRIIIFDIPNNSQIKRESFRGKLKELNFYPLQKSVWIYPYKCQKEIALLREFFSLKKENIRIITAEDIEEDQFLKEMFKLK